MSGGLSGVLNYVALFCVWLTVLVLYLRARRAARDDALIRNLLTVLILDAGKTVLESVYFGLTWGSNWGVLPESLKALGHPLMLSLMKLPTLLLGVMVLVWVIRWWVPAELAERRERRAQEVRLREQLEQSLVQARQSEERFRLAATASRDAFWDWDLRTDAFYTSARFAEMAGKPLGPTVTPADGPPQVIHPDDWDAVKAALAALRSGATPVLDLRHRMVRPDKRIVFVHTTGTVIKDQSGAATRLVGFIRDVTDEVAAEAQRAQHQKLESLGLLAGGIAHDFNNLLGVLSASLTLAERQVDTGRPVQDTLATAALAVQRGTVLTRQLLSYAAREKVSQQPLELNRLVRELVDLFSVTAPKQVRLETQLAPSLPQILGDDGQLQQVVMNLITNAGEAIGAREGSITLQTRAVEGPTGTPVIGRLPTGPAVQLIVTDTGSGMSPEVRAHLFDPFFSTKGSGRGLGLAALAGILRAHGAAAELTSAPNEGTTFTLTFPALVATGLATPVPARAPASVAHDGSALHAAVLVVDDEALLRRSASRLLRNLGCSVTEAVDGLEALEKVRHEPEEFDLVLMDVTMPVMDGFEAARQMQLACPELPIILSSGYAQDFEKRLPKGVLTLNKPYDGEQLEAIVRAALDAGA